jgi:hypothetical protein
MAGKVGNADDTLARPFSAGVSRGANVLGKTEELKREIIRLSSVMKENLGRMKENESMQRQLKTFLQYLLNPAMDFGPPLSPEAKGLIEKGIEGQLKALMNDRVRFLAVHEGLKKNYDAMVQQCEHARIGHDAQQSAPGVMPGLQEESKKFQKLKNLKIQKKKLEKQLGLQEQSVVLPNGFGGNGIKRCVTKTPDTANSIAKNKQNGKSQTNVPSQHPPGEKPARQGTVSPVKKTKKRAKSVGPSKRSPVLTKKKIKKKAAKTLVPSKRPFDGKSAPESAITPKKKAKKKAKNTVPSKRSSAGKLAPEGAVSPVKKTKKVAKIIRSSKRPSAGKLAPGGAVSPVKKTKKVSKIIRSSKRPSGGKSASGVKVKKTKKIAKTMAPSKRPFDGTSEPQGAVSPTKKTKKRAKTMVPSKRPSDRTPEPHTGVTHKKKTKKIADYMVTSTQPLTGNSVLHRPNVAPKKLMPASKKMAVAPKRPVEDYNSLSATGSTPKDGGQCGSESSTNNEVADAPKTATQTSSPPKENCARTSSGAMPYSYDSFKDLPESSKVVFSQHSRVTRDVPVQSLVFSKRGQLCILGESTDENKRVALYAGSTKEQYHNLLWSDVASEFIVCKDQLKVLCERCIRCPYRGQKNNKLYVESYNSRNALLEEYCKASTVLTRQHVLQKMYRCGTQSRFLSLGIRLFWNDHLQVLEAMERARILTAKKSEKLNVRIAAIFQRLTTLANVPIAELHKFKANYRVRKKKVPPKDAPKGSGAPKENGAPKKNGAAKESGAPKDGEKEASIS